MPLASSSRVGLRIKPEVTFGTPVSATKCYSLRTTGESLKYALTTDTSKEIRSDRQTTDLIITGANTAGAINFELSYAEYDSLIEAALQGAWVAFGTNGVSAVIPTSATFAASTLTAGAATSGVNIFTALQLGQWVKISGSSIAGQNIIAQVSKTVSPTSTVLTFEGTPFTGLTGNGGAAVTVSAAQVKNGTTQRSFTVEKNFADITQNITNVGLTVNKMSLALASGSILAGSFDFLGKSASAQVGSLLHATVDPSTAFGVMNGVNNVSNILEGGAVLSGTYIKSLSLDLSNNLRGQEAIGTLGSVSVASGSIDLTGSLEVYFADATLYQKFINNTTSSLSFRVNDSSLNGYVITLPAIEYSDATITAGSINQDVMVSMNFTAVREPVSGNTIVVDRVGAAVVPLA
jgi:hypothetical protein